MTTKEIENIAYNHLWKKGWYGVFEVAVPRSITNKYHRERVDLLSYETNGIFRAYEIKRTKQDFYSGCTWSWIGNYNYFVMPDSLYMEVKDDVPDGIGVWLVREHSKTMECIKKPKRRDLLCPEEDLRFALMQALSREYKKYRKLIEKEEKIKKKNKVKNKKTLNKKKSDKMDDSWIDEAFS